MRQISSLTVLLALLLSTVSSAAQRLSWSGSDFHTLQVVSEASGEGVRFVPLRFRITDDQGRPTDGLICTEVGQGTILVAANVEADVDPAETAKLSSLVMTKFGDSAQIKHLRADQREVWLTLGKASFNVGGVSADPFERIILWQTVEKSLLGLGTRPKLTMRISWTEPLPIRDVQYSFDWQSVLKELSSRASGSKRISRQELYVIAASAIKKRWVRATGASSSPDTLGEPDLLDLVANMIARTLLSAPQAEVQPEDDPNGDKSTFYTLQDKVDLSRVSVSVDLRRSIEVQRILIIRQELPSCL